MRLLYKYVLRPTVLLVSLKTESYSFPLQTHDALRAEQGGSESTLDAEPPRSDVLRPGGVEAFDRKTMQPQIGAGMVVHRECEPSRVRLGTSER